MEERGVKIIVGTIITVILLIVVLSIIFIVKKINKEKQPASTTTEVPLNISTISCSKTDNREYSKKENIVISYNNDDLYKLDVTYTYTYNYEYTNSKLLSELNTIKKNEESLFSTGVSTTFKETERGGELTISYDLSNLPILMYANDKYFYNNIFLDKKELIKYLKNKKYICE